MSVCAIGRLQCDVVFCDESSLKYTTVVHERASPHNPYQFFSTKAGSSPRETVVLSNALALSGAACAGFHMPLEER